MSRFDNDIVPVPYHKGQAPEGAKQADADKKRVAWCPEGAVPADSFQYDEEVD